MNKAMKQSLDRCLAQLRSRVAPVPREDAVIAYNAYLRADIRVQYLSIGDRVAAPPWQTTLPAGQVQLWLDVVDTARSVNAEPDLYIWRVCRDTVYRRYAEQLPQLQQEYLEAMDRLKFSAATTMHSSNQHHHLSTICDRRLMARLPIGSKLSDASESQRKLAEQEAIMTGLPPWGATGTVITPLYRWTAARILGYEELAADLYEVAAIDLWLWRDGYARCQWFMRAFNLADFLRRAEIIYRQLGDRRGAVGGFGAVRSAEARTK